MSRCIRLAVPTQIGAGAIVFATGTAKGTNEQKARNTNENPLDCLLRRHGAAMTGAVKSPIVDGKRQCTRCLEVKPIDEFYRRNRPWRRDNNRPSERYAECKDCFRTRQKKRYRAMFGFCAGLALAWCGTAEAADFNDDVIRYLCSDVPSANASCRDALKQISRPEDAVKAEARVLQSGWPPDDVDPTKSVQYQNYNLSCFWPKPDKNGDRHNMRCRIMAPQGVRSTQ